MGFRKRVWTAVALGVLLTAAGLLDRTVLLRTRVQPDFEPYATHFVEARGWPAAWLVTEPSTGKAPLRGTERIIAASLVFDLLCVSTLSFIVLATIRRAAQAKR